jgi:hypothetical protein
MAQIGRPPIPRLPVDPLLDVLGTRRIGFAAKLLGEVDPRNFYRYCKSGGLPVHYADKLAVRIGRTPHEIWGDLYDAVEWRRVDLDTVRFLETQNMTRPQLQTAVLQVAKLNDWEAHTTDARRIEGGFPDLTLVRPPRLVFAALKTARGRMTEPQKRWRDKLLETQAEWYLWRPADLEMIVLLLGRPMTTRDRWTSYSTRPLDAA